MDPTASPVARRAFVSGRVQGVGFRWSACDEASRRGVVGWVRNLEDGRVEVWVEGAPASVAAMLEWLGHGPPSARVSGVESREVEPAGCADFRARPTAVARG